MLKYRVDTPLNSSSHLHCTVEGNTKSPPQAAKKRFVFNEYDISLVFILYTFRKRNPHFCVNNKNE